MRGTPWWGMVSAAAAPVLLIGGWTLAAARQRAGFDQVAETISALAARDADDRWVMTAALAGLGVCHLTTAAALRDAAPAGRAVLGVGGAATVLVAVFPVPGGAGGSTAHGVAAGIAFTALAVWPAAAIRRTGPVVLGPVVSGVAAAVLLGLLGWFAVELGGDRVGLAERAAAGAQALWPVAAVAGTLVARHRRG